MNRFEPGNGIDLNPKYRDRCEPRAMIFETGVGKDLNLKHG